MVDVEPERARPVSSLSLGASSAGSVGRTNLIHQHWCLLTLLYIMGIRDALAFNHQQAPGDRV